MNKNMKWYLLLILNFIVWGTQHPPIKILSNEISPFLFNFLRFGIACLVLLPFVIKQRILPEKKDLLRISLLGIIGISLYGLLVVIGISLSTATNSSILINSSPLLIAFLAPLLIGEKTNIKKVMGIVLGFIGAVLVISRGPDVLGVMSSEYFFGNILLFSSAFFVAVYSIYNKRFIQKYGGLGTTFYAVLAGTLLLFIMSVVSGDLFQISEVTQNSFLMMSYVAIITTALTWVIWFKSINRIGILNTSSFFFLIPVSGILSSYLILGELLTPFILIGIVLILIGVYIVQKN
ncbi:MAG: DMT family transporter [Candidatus Aenigmarchaeota archaeon]|nr:DMT family transporter [Candidatus Aenigmarchaeota archaeon]